MRPAPRLFIIVPCYNEQDVLPICMPVLLGVLDAMITEGLVKADSRVLLCDDGSSDRTWQIIEDLRSTNRQICTMRLMGNAGQQNATLAALMAVKDTCDCAVTIDADLQDDPMKIAEMVKLYREGAEVVYGVRSSRQTDTWFKRTSAHIFYRFQHLMGLKTIYDHSEFRLMSRTCLQMLSRYDERSLYIRGIIPSLGLHSATVTYPRTARVAGATKYTLSKMLSLSVDGITAFTATPMRLIFIVGLALLALDIAVAIWVLAAYVGHRTVSGWTSLMLSIWFLGSMVLIALGIIGEYIGKIYIEVKHRPRYTIRETHIDT